MKTLSIKFCLFIGFNFFILLSFAQNPNDYCGGIEYGNNNNANASSSIIKLSSTLYVSIGLLRQPFQSTWGSVNVMGIDGCGNLVWDKSVGKSNSKAIDVKSLGLTNDYFMVLAGYCSDYTVNPYYDWLLLKFNAQGDTLWSKTYHAGNYNDFPKCIIQTQDGGFIMGGASDNSINGGEPWQALLIKTDSIGNTEWSKTYGFATASEAITGIVQNFDGTYTISAVRGSASTWVFKTDSVGNILWNRIHGNGNFTYPYSIKPLSDGYLIVGIERIYGFPDYGDGFVLKIDTLGYQQWFKLYGGPFTDQFTDLQILDSGELIVLGSYQNNGWGGEYADAWLMKLTAEGDSIWSYTYAYNVDIVNSDYVFEITDTPENGFMFAGFTSVFNADSTTLTQTAWVVRTDSLGNSCYIPEGCEWAVGLDPYFPPNQLKEENTILVYPNPTQNTLTFNYTDVLKSPSGQRWSIHKIIHG